MIVLFPVSLFNVLGNLDMLISESLRFLFLFLLILKAQAKFS